MEHGDDCTRTSEVLNPQYISIDLFGTPGPLRLGARAGSASAAPKQVQTVVPSRDIRNLTDERDEKLAVILAAR